LQIANAKRTATSLQKARQNFMLLSESNSVAIKSAVLAMSCLVAELEPLAIWARDYKSFCDAEYKKIRASQLEDIANKRWGSDEGKLLFERKIIDELSTQKGRITFGTWMLSRGLHGSIAPDNFAPPISSYKFESGNNLRLQAAKSVEAASGNVFSTRDVSFDGRHVSCCFADYEAYLEYRREVAKTSAFISVMGFRLFCLSLMPVPWCAGWGLLD
jgi:hypothetical protein